MGSEIRTIRDREPNLKIKGFYYCYLICIMLDKCRECFFYILKYQKKLKNKKKNFFFNYLNFFGFF